MLTSHCKETTQPDKKFKVDWFGGHIYRYTPRRYAPAHSPPLGFYRLFLYQPIKDCKHTCSFHLRPTASHHSWRCCRCKLSISNTYVQP